MAVRAGVMYVSVVLFLSDVLSARKLGISYSRTEGGLAYARISSATIVNVLHLLSPGLAYLSVIRFKQTALETV